MADTIPRTTTRSAAIYVRLSQDREGQTSTERQEAEARGHAERLGLPVAEVFSDVGVSGFKKVDRPGFDAALAALEAGKVSTLIVWKLDRLSRQGMGQVGAILDRLEETGGRIVSVMDGVDTSQAAGRMVVALLSEQARAESENASTRILSARRRERSEGKWHGGPPPFGLEITEDRRLAPHPINGPILRRLVEDVIGGASIRSLVVGLNEEGIPGPRGGQWHNSTLSKLLRSPSLAGLLPHRGDIYRDEDGEPVSVGDGIISPAERRRLLAAIDARSRTISRGQKAGKRAGAGPLPKYLLTGLLACGECGAALVHSGARASKTYYRCTGRVHGAKCPGNSVYSPPAEEAVTNAALRRLSALEPGDPLLATVASRWVAQALPETEGDRADLRAEADDARAALADLEEARYVRGEFRDSEGPARYDRLRFRLEERLATAEAALTDLPPVEPDVGAILDSVLAREAWADATVADRRAVLALAIDRVVVSKAAKKRGRFDPGRLSIEWAAP